MNRVDKLKPVLELAQRRERDAAAAFGQSRKALEDARASLTNLENFRERYAQRFHDAGTLSIRQLQEFRAFLDKLGRAVADQEQRVKRAEADLEQKKRAWENAHGRVLGMTTLVDKAQAELDHQEQRREQLEQDDRNGRRLFGDKGPLSVFF